MLEGAPVTFDSYKDIRGYVINLDRERWRYDVARKELTEAGFTNIHRWTATDYKEEDVVTEMRTLGATKLERFYNCAEMACALSHLRIMHHFLTTKDPYCFIFEDDVITIPEFKQVANFNDIKYGEFDLLCFGAAYASPDHASWRPGSVEWYTTNFKPLAEAEEQGKSHVSNCCFWLAHAYLINRKAAYTLTRNYSDWVSCNEYRVPFIDVYMSCERKIRNKLLSYRKMDNPAQYSTGNRFGDRFCGIMMQRAGFNSTIVNAS